MKTRRKLPMQKVAYTPGTMFPNPGGQQVSVIPDPNEFFVLSSALFTEQFKFLAMLSRKPGEAGCRRRLESNAAAATAIDRWQ